MMTFAKKYGISFKSFEENRFDDYKVIPDLKMAKEELEGFALQNEGAVSVEATINTLAVLKKVRNKYLHISANPNSMGMGANYEMGKVRRKIIKDNA
jgi:hypothetical protein